ncbi:MAG: hypothetical protein ABIZ80_16970 [Bryobacteraceae bacterium]
MSVSLIRFTNALTIFGIQQMQNAFGAVTDSRATLARFCQTLDSLSEALSGQIDLSRKSTSDSVSRGATPDFVRKPYPNSVGEPQNAADLLSAR